MTPVLPLDTFTKVPPPLSLLQPASPTIGEPHHAIGRSYGQGPPPFERSDTRATTLRLGRAKEKTARIDSPRSSVSTSAKRFELVLITVTSSHHGHAIGIAMSGPPRFAASLDRGDP